ncbi:MAG TPA: hypothetical protein VMY77_13475 [Chitinophagaceae bacterium]|nr:hypothetical protein [Chitinophagaceae bacterium]
MTDKKIIENKNVKENNPNDDEEILKNHEGLILGPGNENEEEPNKTNEKSHLNETPGTP